MKYFLYEKGDFFYKYMSESCETGYSCMNGGTLRHLPEVVNHSGTRLNSVVARLKGQRFDG